MSLISPYADMSALTLMPTPTSANSTRSSSSADSARTPQTFLPAISTSFGHLMRGRSSVSSSIARQTANGVISTRWRSCVSSGRTMIVMCRFSPGEDTQDRPIRPRPALWSSAIATPPSGPPARASRAASSIVELVDS